MVSAAARSLIETYSDINENLDFSEIKKKKNIFALRVNRDSMIDKCVADGVIFLMEKITYWYLLRNGIIVSAIVPKLET